MASRSLLETRPIALPTQSSSHASDSTLSGSIHASGEYSPIQSRLLLQHESNLRVLVCGLFPPWSVLCEDILL